MKTLFTALILTLGFNAHALSETSPLALNCVGDMVKGFPQQYVVTLEEEPRSLLATVEKIQLGQVVSSSILSEEEFSLVRQDEINYAFLIKATGETLSCSREEVFKPQQARVDDIVIQKVTPSSKTIGALNRSAWCSHKIHAIRSANFATDIYIWLLEDGYYTCRALTSSTNGEITVDTKKCVAISESDICL